MYELASVSAGSGESASNSYIKGNVNDCKENLEKLC
jgi:hypothetical protein